LPLIKGGGRATSEKEPFKSRLLKSDHYCKRREAGPKYLPSGGGKAPEKGKREPPSSARRLASRISRGTVREPGRLSSRREIKGIKLGRDTKQSREKESMRVFQKFRTIRKTEPRAEKERVCSAVYGKRYSRGGLTENLLSEEEARGKKYKALRGEGGKGRWGKGGLKKE